MIAIIKYNAGNITSVQNALNRLGYESIITDNEDEIRNADKVIFPGVGEASTAMQYLQEKKLDVLIKSLTQPMLGICLGQQLMCTFSEENNTACLGIFDAEVKLFPPTELVPHIGWNNIEAKQSKLFEGIEDEDNFYFVHSYYATICENTIATCNYILPFSAAMQKNNFYATQFHPEKSADVGETVLRNFLEISTNNKSGQPELVEGGNL
jgi:imidazole glycerol-phosphate synthase subunit HisH